MESNGKSVRLDGSPVDAPTGDDRVGTPGTNGQHAYFQLLHQGTTLVPIDFIGFAQPQPGHELGRAPGSAGRATCSPRRKRWRSATARVDAEGVSPPVPHRRSRATVRRACCSPTQLTPHALGALIAAYEHKVMTLGAIWGIDSFDQWGVELGKVLAGRIVDELEADAEPALAHDELDQRA